MIFVFFGLSVMAGIVVYYSCAGCDMLIITVVSFAYKLMKLSVKMTERSLMSS